MIDGRDTFGDWVLITKNPEFDWLRYGNWDISFKFRHHELNLDKDEITFITPEGLVLSIGLNEIPTELIEKLGELHD